MSRRTPPSVPSPRAAGWSRPRARRATRTPAGVLLALALLVAAPPAVAQDDGPPPAMAATKDVIALVGTSERDLAAFVAKRVAPELRDRVGDEALVASLGAVLDAIGRRLPADARPAPGGEIVLSYPVDDGDPRMLHVRVDLLDTTSLADLWLEDGPGLDPREDHAAPRPLAPITWETLAARLQEEADAGWFSGAALVLRDREVVLREGYGLADRASDRANTPETIFAIGSTPIDFTKIAVRILIARDELAWDTTLAELFDDVPADKAGITVEQLMTGASGFRDFFDVPEDGNADHAWIERDELVRRMFASELLFEPGTDREHSHGAFGLLSAIVELVSGRSYQAFTREEIFAKAGMPDTGFFGEPLPGDRVAVGYGLLTNGEVNAPPWWGPTSWLVMGSGGMVSTLDDLLAFQRALRAGEVLPPDDLAGYWAPPGAISSNGDAFGFELYYTETVGEQVFLISNSTTPRTRHRLEELFLEIVRLPRG